MAVCYFLNLTKKENFGSLFIWQPPKKKKPCNLRKTYSKSALHKSVSIRHRTLYRPHLTWQMIVLTHHQPSKTFPSPSLSLITGRNQRGEERCQGATYNVQVTSVLKQGTLINACDFSIRSIYEMVFITFWDYVFESASVFQVFVL